MEKIKNEKDLLLKLKNDIKNCNKNKVVFLCGHFPLLYSKDNQLANEAFLYWGKFSVYTFELACIIAKYAKKIGKKIEFVIFVDDHAYEDMNNMSPRELSRKRNRLYILRSGKEAFLPEEYKKILNKYGFSEKNILRQDQRKDGRTNCLYFSEKLLRTSQKKIENICAREYTEFIDNPEYFNKKSSYFIAFIPNRCKNHICDVALGREVKNLNSSHIFMETLVPSASTKDLFEKGVGVTYRKD